MTLYFRGRILTMVGKTAQYVDAVVEKAGKIAFTGSYAKAKTLFPDASEVDLEGRTMMPGHIDPHLHPSMAALILEMQFITPFDWILPDPNTGLPVTYKGVRTQDGYRKRLGELIDQGTEKSANTNGFLITWGYHQYFHGEISRTVIDEINAMSSKIPIVVWHRSFHELYLNTNARDNLKYDDVETIKKNPQVEWDRGHFFEMGLDALLSTTSFKDTVFPMMKAGYTKIVQVIHQNGMTAVADLEFPLMEEEIEIAKANEILKNKEITHFSTFCVASARNYARMFKGDHQKAVEHIQELAKTFSDDQVILYNNHVKGLCDGAFYSQAMQMRDGYIDGHDGEWIMKPVELEDMMRVYWRNGFQIHVHTNGDLGMKTLLDIVETLNKESPRENHRVTVEHAGYFTEDQADRIAKLGLLVSAAPYYFYTLADKYSAEGLGTARAQAMVPMKWLFDRGVTTAFHSDFTMAPSQPLLLAWSAINRVTADGNVYREDLKVTPYQGMQAITKNAAIIMGTDDIMGTIEGGKLANFTILEQNPLAVQPMSIKDIKIYASVYKGKMYKIKTQ